MPAPYSGLACHHSSCPCPDRQRKGNADAHGSEGMHADAACGLNRQWPTSDASGPSVCIPSDPCASAFPLPVCGSKPGTRDRGDFPASPSRGPRIEGRCGSRLLSIHARRQQARNAKLTKRHRTHMTRSAAIRCFVVFAFLACCLRENQYASLIRHGTSDVAHLLGMRRCGRVCLVAANRPRCVKSQLGSHTHTHHHRALHPTSLGGTVLPLEAPESTMLWAGTLVALA